MSAPNRQGLTPVAALCLRVVKGWLRVVRQGKGGELRNGVPYTRLKASEVQEQLEREEGVEVGYKTVQRALTELVVGGHLTRRQLYKHRYNRTYWYAPSEQEQQAQAHRPSVVAASKQSKRPSQPVPTERTRVSSQALKAQITPSPLTATNSQTAQQPTTEEAPCGQPQPQQEAVSKAWGRRRQAATAASTGRQSSRLQQAQQALTAAVQRATARGFGQASTNASPIGPAAVRYKAESPQAAGFLR